MKKLVIVSAMLVGLSTPSYAWYDSYGGFTCGYLDPLTSFLDSIFGPPCPPPVAVPVQVAQSVPVNVAQSYPQPQRYVVSTPAPIPVPASPMPRSRLPGGQITTNSCGPVPCGYGGVGGGNVGPNVGNGLGIPPEVYDSGIGFPNPYASPYY